MTAPGGAPPPPPGRRAAVLWIGIVVLVIAVAALAGQRGGSTRPLDPASTEPDGAKALVLLLEALGAEVDVVRGAPPAGATAAVVLHDRLDDDDRAATLGWVEGGGTLVVGDPFSELAGAALEASESEACPRPLVDVDRLRYPDDRVLQRGADCFRGTVVVGARGQGDVAFVDPVAFGVFEPSALFMNGLLDEEDNAVLAAVLLAPDGGARVAFLDGAAGAGATSLADLVGRPMRQGLVQLLVAAVLYVLWRGRRLGRPVVEEQPVAIAGSELVAAVGRLMDGRRRPDEAAAVLRADLRRALELRLGVPSTGPADAAAEAVAARTGLDPARVLAALDTGLVTSDGELVELAHELDRIRALCLDPTPTTTLTATP